MFASEEVYHTGFRTCITVLFDLQDPEQRRAFLEHQAGLLGECTAEWLDEDGEIAALHLFPGRTLKVVL